MDLHFAGAHEIAARIRAGRLTSLAAVEHHIARITCLDRRINAVCVRDFARARAKARSADQYVAALRADAGALNCGAAAAAGAATTTATPLPPLFVLPITVKESWWVEGLPATCGGMPKRQGFVAPSNAPLVTRLLEDAGAILLGKTNLPEEASDWQTFNSHYGTTCNPLEFSRSPGGSSGGSAAAVAAGFSALELGSDIAGSIRIPAHACGVCGLKPSQGLLTWAGSSPSGNHWLLERLPAPARSRFDPVHHAKLQVAGPIARTCADLELALRVLAGPGPYMAQVGWSLSLPEPRVTEPRHLRVAVWANDDFCTVDRALAQLIEAAGAALARRGAHVDYTARPGASTGDDTFFARSHQHYQTLLAAALRADTEKGPPLHDDVEYAERKRQAFREAWYDFFLHDGAAPGTKGGWDVLLCPVMPFCAIRHDQTGASPALLRRVPCVDGATQRTVEGGKPYELHSRWVGLTTFADLPVVVVPVGRVGGLTCGAQIVGRPGEELQAIEVGKMLEREGCSFDAVTRPIVERSLATIEQVASRL